MNNNNRKNSERFLEELGNIDDKFLEEAMNYKKKKISIKKIVAAAACVALMIGTIPLISHFAGTPAGTPADTTGGVVTPSVIKLGNNLTAYDMQPHDGSDLGAEYSDNFQTEKIKYFYDNAKDGEKKTITINGKTYTGVYQTSIESPRYNDDTDIYYKKENGNVLYHFEINRATGMVTSFGNGTVYNRVYAKKYTEKECYAIAKEFLNTIIDDIDEYELCKAHEPTWGNVYYFTLCKPLNGMHTSDCINIGVTMEGEIYLYTIIAHNSMDNVDASAITLEMIDKTISEKIATMYRKNPDVTYEYDSISLIRCRDGSFYIDCDLMVYGNDTETGKAISDCCYIAITME